MAYGYVIGQMQITNAEQYEKYRAQVVATVTAHGGEFLVRGGAQEVIEGKPPGGRSVILRFPSVEAAENWYNSPEYQKIIPIRQGASTGALTIVEGV
ncbi:DUF1330 domain-containing protein [Rhodobacteraceae bacterium NNCM2]|nr:DUF1330 domain-containing protein [Coraliihabitans acroporae]